MRSLGTIMWVATKGAKNPYDLTAPLATSFEPHKIPRQTSEDTHTEHQTHVEPASRARAPCQEEKVCRQAELPPKYSRPEN
jgi:hypothetical protein